jgi:hypothetical protein
MKERCLATVAALLLATTPLLAAGPLRAGDQPGAAAARERLRGLTPEEIQQFVASFKPRPATPRVNAVNGRGSMALDESYDHHLMARINIDGSVSFACNDHHPELIEFISQAAPSDTILRLKPLAARTVAAERE